MSGLARLLNGEEQVSDLIAFLVELDSEPLRRALGLRVSALKVVRESLITSPGGGQSGRIDLLVSDATGSPLALVEVKLGAGQHGQQYGLYAEWAAQHAPAPGCWLVSLSGRDSDAPAGWRTHLTLPQLVGAWRESTHPHAAWLGGMVADVLDRRALQLHQRLGLADDPIVADLLVKQLKADLEASPTFARVRGWMWSGMRTDGGAPMLLVWVPLPGRDEYDVSLTLDLRAEVKELRPRRWVLRLGVQVDATDGRTEAQAKVLANDLATAVAQHLTRSAFTDSLPPDLQHLEAALVTRDRAWRDGLAGHPSMEKLDRWRTAAAAGEKTGRHPMLFHDGGLRLASQLPVDASSLDRHDMLALLEAALTHLGRVARDVATAMSKPRDAT